MDEQNQAGEALAELLRQHHATQIPKAHIPIGIGAFLILSALSPVAIVPFLGAGLVLADAGKRIRDRRQIVQQSYADPSVLMKKLTPAQKQTVDAFIQQFSSPKALPLEETPGVTWDLTDVQAFPIVEPEPDYAPVIDEPDHFVDADKMVELVPIPDGWHPQELPCLLPEFLARQIHVLISATTGSGKTHMLQCLCATLANRGHRLLICDPKGSRWGQLEPVVWRMDSGSDYFAIASDLDKELKRRIKRNKDGEDVGAHLWVVFDEWTLLKGLCATLTREGQLLFQQRILMLIGAGRELNMHLIMVNQSHQLGDLSLTPGVFSAPMRDNLCTLGLGCKTTKDNQGDEMEGNDKSINSILQDSYLIKQKKDCLAAQAYHAQLRQQPQVNRTYCLHASSLRIGVVPDLEIPAITQLRCFYDDPPDEEVTAA